MPSRRVFISYARSGSSEAAHALHDALSERLAFLDTHGIDDGDSIPESVLAALLDAHLVVAFIDPVYFTRRYCVEELAVALAAYRALSRRGADGSQLAGALRPVVVARANAGDAELDQLPPDVRAAKWPDASDTAALLALVTDRLRGLDVSIGQSLARLGLRDEIRETLAEALAIPAPSPLGPIRYTGDGFSPSLHERFVGRARELWEIHVTLAGGGRRGTTVALEGGAGFGKTRLALEYVHRHGGRSYPGGVFWLDAGGDRVEEQLHGILGTLEPDTPNLPLFRAGGRDVRAELEAALSRRGGGPPVLYVVDDVPETPPGTAVRRLEEWCPAPAAVSLLVTSRHRRSLERPVRGIAIGELDRESAVTLIRARCESPPAASQPSWDAIVDAVGRHPLALDLLNRSLELRVLSLAELTSRLRATDLVDELDQQLAAQQLQTTATAHRGLAATLDLSYTKLTTRGREAALVLAQMAAAPIPLDLVSALGELMPYGVRLELRARSYVGDATSESIELYGGMHRLLVAFLRSRVGDSRTEARTAVSALLSVMGVEAVRDPARWPLMNACAAHADALFTRWASAPVRDVTSAPVVRLGLVLGLLHREQGRTRDARSWAERSLALGLHTLGDRHRGTLEAMGSVAAARFDEGELTGPRRLQERVLKARRELLGDGDPDTLRAMTGLAATAHAQGDLVLARRLSAKALAGWRRLRKDPETLRSMAGLAATLHAQRDLAGARDLLERVVEARTRSLGDEHLETLQAMAALASVLHHQGALKDALDRCRHVARTRLRWLGTEHPETLRAMGALASVLRAMAAHTAAGELERHVARASPARHAPGRPER